MLAWLRRQCGSQIVEFTLIAPILIYLVFAIPTIGFAVHSWMILEAAAREGARDLAISQDAASARNIVYREVTRFGGLPVHHSAPKGSKVLFANSEEFIQVTMGPQRAEVTVVYYQPVALPGLGLILTGSTEPYIELRSSASFRREYLSPG